MDQIRRFVSMVALAVGLGISPAYGSGVLAGKVYDGKTGQELMI